MIKTRKPIYTVRVFRAPDEMFDGDWIGLGVIRGQKKETLRKNAITLLKKNGWAYTKDKWRIIKG